MPKKIELTRSPRSNNNNVFSKRGVNINDLEVLNSILQGAVEIFTSIEETRKEHVTNKSVLHNSANQNHPA